MTFTEAFDKGFKVTNNNWQLVLVQLAFFIIIAGITFLGALLLFTPLFGASLLEPGGFNMNDFAENMDQYLGPIMIFLLAFLVYITVVMLASVYLYGANCGVIARSVKDESLKFNLKAFFSEGNRLFLPALGFLTLITVVVIAEFILVGLAAFPLYSLIKFMHTSGSGLFMLTVVVVILVGGITLFFMTAGTFALTTYGAGIMAMDSQGAFGSLKKGFTFLKERPSALWFFLLAIIIAFCANLLMSLGGMIVPIFGDLGGLIILPVQICGQAYVSFVVFGWSFSYYWGFEKPIPVVHNDAQFNDIDTLQGDDQGRPPLPDDIGPVNGT